jgi:tRNA-dihydrouridine synthase
VRETNVDGALLGRSAQGNPWIFRTKEQVKQALRSKGAVSIPHVPVSLKERFRVILEHSSHFEKQWGNSSFVGMRKHLAWYCRNSRGAAELRSQMVRTNNVSEVVERLRNYATWSLQQPVEKGSFAVSRPGSISPVRCNSVVLRSPDR